LAQHRLAEAEKAVAVVAILRLRRGKQQKPPLLKPPIGKQ
jgi:hypothetical protein